MIIKGNVRQDGSSLGNYLLSEGRYAKNQQKNEGIEVWQASGFEQGDRLQDILNDFEHSAIGTQCEKALFHVQIRTGEGEHLSRDQFFETINRLEEKLELSGHERVVVAHTLDGQEHVHVVWNRIDHEQRKAADLHYYKNKSADLARELEKEFGLRELSPSKQQGKLSRDEERQAIRHGQAPQEIKDAIRDCWQQSDSGKAFSAALDEHGYMLAAGDRRDFVIVDEQGGTYSVARVTGSKATEVRNRLSDIDRESLPSVEDAKDIQFDRYHGNRSTRDEIEWEEGLAEAGIKKAKSDAVREREEKLKNWKNKTEKRHAHIMASIYSKADMVTVQQSAMRYLKEKHRYDRNKREQEEATVRLMEKIQRLEKEAQEREQTVIQPEKAKPGQTQHQPAPEAQQEQKLERQEERKTESQPDASTDFWASIRGMKKELQSEAKEEKRDRTEQTEYQQRKAERDAMREQLNPQQQRPDGRSRDDDDDYGRER
jgi:hypothetical protein